MRSVSYSNTRAPLSDVIERRAVYCVHCALCCVVLYIPRLDSVNARDLYLHYYFNSCVPIIFTKQRFPFWHLSHFRSQMAVNLIFSILLYPIRRACSGIHFVTNELKSKWMVAMEMKTARTEEEEEQRKSNNHMDFGSDAPIYTQYVVTECSPIAFVD